MVDSIPRMSPPIGHALLTFFLIARFEDIRYTVSTVVQVTTILSGVSPMSTCPALTSFPA
jgi:hypothetical protein